MAPWPFGQSHDPQPTECQGPDHATCPHQPAAQHLPSAVCALRLHGGESLRRRCWQGDWACRGLRSASKWSSHSSKGARRQPWRTPTSHCLSRSEQQRKSAAFAWKRPRSYPGMALAMNPITSFISQFPTFSSRTTRGRNALMRCRLAMRVRQDIPLSGPAGQSQS